MEDSEKEKKGIDVTVIVLSVFGALFGIVVLYLLWTYFFVNNKNKKYLEMNQNVAKSV